MRARCSLAFADQGITIISHDIGSFQGAKDRPLTTYSMVRTISRCSGVVKRSQQASIWLTSMDLVGAMDVNVRRHLQSALHHGAMIRENLP